MASSRVTGLGSLWVCWAYSTPGLWVSVFGEISRGELVVQPGGRQAAVVLRVFSLYFIVTTVPLRAKSIAGSVPLWMCVLTPAASVYVTCRSTAGLWVRVVTLGPVWGAPCFILGNGRVHVFTSPLLRP